MSPTNRSLSSSRRDRPGTGRWAETMLRRVRTGTGTKRADHSWSDINPVGFYRCPALTGHKSDSSGCWRRTHRGGDVNLWNPTNWHSQWSPPVKATAGKTDLLDYLFTHLVVLSYSVYFSCILTILNCFCIWFSGFYIIDHMSSCQLWSEQAAPTVQCVLLDTMGSQEFGQDLAPAETEYEFAQTESVCAQFETQCTGWKMTFTNWNWL